MRISDWSADLCSSDLPDGARGHIDVGADVAIEFGHKTLAKAHDLAHALALRIEVRPTLAAAHRQPGQRVLERLLEREEFEHAFGDARVKAASALVRRDGFVVLDPPAALDPDIALVILPNATTGHTPISSRDPPREQTKSAR